MIEYSNQTITCESDSNPKWTKIEWFKGGQLNITENALDRHLEKNGDTIAFHWEANHKHVYDNEYFCGYGIL